MNQTPSNTDSRRRVIALGFFDGVHLGHQALLRRCREAARQRGAMACAMTFDPHPSALLQGRSVPLVNTLADREELLRRFGMEQVLVAAFDRQTMEQPWDSFVRDTLLERYQACHVVCGYDYRFGYRGEGTPEKLKALCGTLGLGCDVIDGVRLEGSMVSSTGIRALLEAGQMERAVAQLGHGHLLSGVVQPGRQLGRTIGIPTANLFLPEGLVCPARGVYACKAYTGGREYLAVTNVGVRPTVSGSGLTVEPWILDFSGDLYGKPLKLEFFAFLRPERRFPSLEALREEILQNAWQTRALLESR